MTNICLIDDDQNILASLSLTLKSEGYNIKTFSDGLSGLTSLQEDNYDIAILDIKMPRLDGLEVLQELRQTSNLPVIFLTSKDEEVDELLGTINSKLIIGIGHSDDNRNSQEHHLNSDYIYPSFDKNIEIKII